MDELHENYHLTPNNPLLTQGTEITAHDFVQPIYYSNIKGFQKEDTKFIHPLLLPQYYPISKDVSQIPVSRIAGETISVGAY